MGMTASQLRNEFHELLALHQGQIIGFIFAAVRNLHDAQDLYQETCITAWEKFSEFELGSNFARWACGIARLEILEHQRRHAREKRWLSEHVLLRLAEAASPADAEAAQRRHEYLASCFASLSKPDQRLIEKCYTADKSGHVNKLSDIAKQAGMQVASLYNALSRIRRRLFHCIRTKVSQEARQ
jgi:RNA polymerase sigma-70 factor (ECF subfamily)